MLRDKYKKIIAPFLAFVLNGMLAVVAVLCRALPRSWLWWVIHHLSRLLTTIKRTVPYSHSAASDRRVEPIVLGLVLDSFTKHCRSFTFPYRAVGVELIRELRGERKGLLMCGSHSFLLNRLAYNVVRDVGIVPIRVSDIRGIRVWGRGELLNSLPTTLELFTRIARSLRDEAVVVILCDWGEANVCPKIFEFAKLVATPVLFFATRIGPDEIPEIIIKSPPKAILTSEGDLITCIEAYRSFVAHHAGTKLNVARRPMRFST